MFHVQSHFIWFERIPGVGATRSPFPLVRRSSAMVLGRPEPLARPLPRLLSLELFNPETDDMDSDSSGVSSPDSVSSVISVLTEEPPQTQQEVTGNNFEATKCNKKISGRQPCSRVKPRFVETITITNVKWQSSSEYGNVEESSNWTFTAVKIISQYSVEW